MKAALSHFRLLSLTLSLAALVSACANKPRYDYARQPDSAYIIGAVMKDETRSVIFDMAKIGILVYTVDGQEVEYDYPYSALRTSENPPLEIYTTPIALKPGTRQITITLAGYKRKKEVSFTLDAAPSERYTIMQKTDFTRVLIVNVPNFVTFWVVNSKGEQVVPPQTIPMV